MLVGTLFPLVSCGFNSLLCDSHNRRYVRNLKSSSERTKTSSAANVGVSVHTERLKMSHTGKYSAVERHHLIYCIDGGRRGS